MLYSDFEHILSAKRMQRYLVACNGDTRKAMTLYRLNLRLSHEMFTVVSCFEIALRNAIHQKLIPVFGQDWLRDSILQGGMFYSLPEKSKRNIVGEYNKMDRNGSYDPDQMVASMEFGTWKYMFSQTQYRVTGQCLMDIFPSKPRSSAQFQYDRRYFFNELDHVNSIRNRIAHHEPICFTHTSLGIDTSYIETEYDRIKRLFSWMNIDSNALLYGLDHVKAVCKTINKL